jgi:NAD(P)-dependent dehydrogenase (short-subunit alcohol dehydrogenase family)
LPRGPKGILKAPTDVVDPEQVKRLRDTVIAKFGKVNLLANNAATRIGRGNEAPLADWRRAVDVNLWGPILGVRAFLPVMLASTEPGVIVNVGSKQGITNPPGHPVYNMTKAALKAYTESLEHELRSSPNNVGRRVTAHLLIPGWTTTGTQEHKPGAWLPEQVVDAMLSGIARGDFYIICPDGEVTAEMDKKRILWAAGDMTENRPALSRWHPDYADVAKQACS